jgi:hypothetical protein
MMVIVVGSGGDTSGDGGMDITTVSSSSGVASSGIPISTHWRVDPTVNVTE